jgi:uncharacterized protein YndB with AHSA1/START domain
LRVSDSIEKTIELRAPVERVWRALTDHEEFGAWFKVRLDGPFVVGERSRGQMTYPGYEDHPWDARVLVMEAPRLFAFEWPHVERPDEDLTKAPWTQVEFRLEPLGAGTRLTVTESGFEALPPDRRVEFMRRNEGGWAIQVENIKAHVGG